MTHFTAAGSRAVLAALGNAAADDRSKAGGMLPLQRCCPITGHTLRSAAAWHSTIHGVSAHHIRST